MICPTVSVFSDCTLSVASSFAPASLLAIYLLFALPWPRSIRKAAAIIASPFTEFITLQDAKAALAHRSSPSGATDALRKPLSRPVPPIWKTLVLTAVALIETVSWIWLASYNLAFYASAPSIRPAWTAYSPFIHSLPWLYAAIIPVLRPKATPPYDLFCLYLLYLIMAVVRLGSGLFQMTAYGWALPAWWVVLGWCLDLTGSLVCVALVFSFPIEVPDSEEEKAEIGKTITPEDYTTFFQWITFNWVSPLVWKGLSVTLNEPDIWNLSPTMRSRVLYSKYRTSKQKSTLRTIAHNNSLDLILDVALTFASTVFNYAGPFFLKRILDAIADPTSEKKSMAWLYATFMFGATILKAEADVLHLWYGRRAGTRLRTELMADIYEKALRRKDFSGLANNNSTSEKEKDKKGKEKEPSAKTQADVGKIVQLMSSDANRIAMMTTGLYFLYGAPFEIGIAVVFLYQLLGWSAFAGFILLIIATPLNTYLSRRSIKISKGLLAVRDKRMGISTELINAIKFIKFFAWESQWVQRVMTARTEELNWIIKSNINSLIFNFMWTVLPVGISVASFLVFVAQGNEMTVSVAFTSIALFGMLRTPLTVVPSFLVSLLQTYVSVERIDAFLAEGEVPEYVSSLTRPAPDPTSPPDMRLGAENAVFRWNSSEETKDTVAKPKTMDLPSVPAWKRVIGGVLKPWKRYSSRTNGQHTGEVLNGSDSTAVDEAGSVSPQETPFELVDINVMFPVGQLSVVTGPTASGKTALLMALLGEMTMLQGELHLPKDPSQVDELGLRNAISYSAQTAWLEQQSIKDNILFGSPLEEDRYEAVIEACALKLDFSILEDGDATEIGARGVALSGGQKARVALARAAYARTKHVLLDDPLAALDSHSARYVFEHLLQGPLMQHRTVILVTHHVELVLPGADYLVRMLDGRIDTQGTIKELRERGILQDITISENEEEQRLKAAEDGVAARKEVSPPDAEPQDPLKMREPSNRDSGKKARKLVKDEARAEGGVKWKIYRTYLEASSLWLWGVIISFIFVFQALGVGEKYWIKIWGEHYDVDAQSRYMTSLLNFHASSAVDTSYNELHQALPLFVTALPTFGLETTQTLLINGSSAVHSGTTAMRQLPSANSHPFFYIGIFAAIGLAACTLSSINSIFQYISAYIAARSLFARLLQTVVRAPIRWFDTTPSGRILNRLSRDIETIDTTICFSIRSTTVWMASFLASLLTVIIFLPPFIVPAVVIGYAYYKMSLGYLNTGRDLRRMESNSKSPIFSGFAELLDGIVTVRAFSAEQRMFDSLHDKLDLTTNMWWSFWMMNRWLLYRFDILGSFAVYLTTIIALSGWVDVGLAGVTITSAMSFTNSVYWTCRMFTQLEMDLNAVERVVEYLELPAEPPAIVESNRPPAGWPSSSQSDTFLVVEDLVVSYAPELEPVLHHISFEATAREKIGLMGRTGSGKSTLAMSLLRFVEPTNGRIVLDGIDISQVGLQDLRSRVTIIPQDAVLFSGTIRENLDPFGEHTDEECYDALYRVHLMSESRHASQRSSRTPSRAGSRAPSPSHDGEGSGSITSSTVIPEERVSISLETKVSPGGTNFSQGQRQLIAMARALLRNSSVIIMDEATASVDFETDTKIQTTIRNEFQNSLLLTVAHRIRTVIDYDRLLVLDAGRVAEFDTPWNLLQKEDGIFKNMCLQSGMYQELMEAAERKYKEASS